MKANTSWRTSSPIRSSKAPSTLTARPVDADVVRLTPSEDSDSYQVRPEIAEAMRLARGEIGKVNAKKTGGDGKRVGWERLREYFRTAFGGPWSASR